MTLHVATVRTPRGKGLTGRKAQRRKRLIAMNQLGRRAARAEARSALTTTTRGSR